MMKSILSILVLLAMLAAPCMGAANVLPQYNQSWADTDNGGANIWGALATWNTFLATDNGNQVLIINTTAGTATSTPPNGINVTIHSGPFIQGALGDKLYTLSVNKTYILGPFETSRFLQANGTILIQTNATRGKAFVVGVP